MYVDLQYDEISLIFTARFVSLCCVCCHVVAFGLSVVVAVTVMRVLLFVLRVCMMRECDGARMTAMLVWGMDEVWLW